MDSKNHIYPLNDLKEHLISIACWCKPFGDDELIIHNAADGREFVEEEERQAIVQGMRDIAAGRVKPLEEVRRQIVKRSDH